MPTEDIAKAVTNLTAHRYVAPAGLDENTRQLAKLFIDATHGTVVNATPLYDQYIANDRPIAVYEDHECIFPAWKNALICYENQYGNITMLALVVIDREKVGDHYDPEPEWETHNPVEWSRVRWKYVVLAYVGGSSTTLGAHLPTRGPLLRLDCAVADTGEPCDIHWMDLAGVTTEENRSDPSAPHSMWGTALTVFLETLKFMACRNVELVDEIPADRAARRRLERVGVRVKTLTVRPLSRRQEAGRSSASQGVPLHSVVGHPAHYGDCCPGIHEPKGLLFGKITGRFFVQQHARGSSDYGEVQKSYTLLPDG